MENVYVTETEASNYLQQRLSADHPYHYEVNRISRTGQFCRVGETNCIREAYRWARMERDDAEQASVSVYIVDFTTGQFMLWKSFDKTINLQWMKFSFEWLRLY